jgi:uncharacterized membrane protein
MLYPPLVYFGMGVISPKIFVAIGLALIGSRFFGLRHKPEAKMWGVALLVAALSLVAMLLFDARLAVQAYPVIVSLSFSAIFGFSLLFPPTVVERIARLAEPDLPPSGAAYTRKVTVVWAIVLLINAFVSMATTLWGSLAQWTLWNGLLSYLLMGSIFVGEWLIRKRVRQCP